MAPAPLAKTNRDFDPKKFLAEIIALLPYSSLEVHRHELWRRRSVITNLQRTG